MAFTVTNLGSTEYPSATSSAVLAGNTASIGDLIVVVVSARNSGTSGAARTTTCADAASNTYTQRTQVNRTPGSVADDGATLTIFTSVLTSALSSQNITISFSGGDVTRVSAHAKKFAPGAGETASYVSVGAGVADETFNVQPSITSGSITSGDTIVGALASSYGGNITADSDTSNGSWSTQYAQVNGESAPDGINVASQQKTVTATATQTYNPSGLVGQYAVNYIVVRSAAGNKTLAAGGGSYAFTGTAATLTKGKKLAAAAGSYAITGTAATLKRGRKNTASAGSYAFTGTAATPKRGRKVAGAAGSYAFTGTAATLKHAWRVTAAAGSYVFTGTAATLRRSLPMVAGAGSYAFTGTAASLKHGWKVAGAASSYAFTGTDAALSKSGISIAAGAGSYALTGTASSFLRTWRISAAAGSYAFTGTAASPLYGRKASAGAGSYLFTGTAALFRKTGWTAQSIESETWTARSIESETWTAAGIDSETWTVN